jgi:hypothetical protein
MKEPIAYINVEKRTLEFAEPIKWHTPTVANLDRIPLFTQRTWVGLTDEEAKKIQTIMIYGNYSFIKIIQTIEAKLKQKNGYAEEKNT